MKKWDILASRVINTWSEQHSNELLDPRMSVSNTYVFDVYKPIASVGGCFSATKCAEENDFLGLSRREAGRCVWHGSSTGLLLKIPREFFQCHLQNPSQ